MRFMQTESVLQSKNRSGPAKNRFSIALPMSLQLRRAKIVMTVLFYSKLKSCKPFMRIQNFEKNQMWMIAKIRILKIIL